MKHILGRPIITEQSLLLASRGWYSFAVTTLARKEQIKQEIESIYGVSVTKVRSMRMHGKVRKSGKKMRIYEKADWKKALVTLSKGQHIDAFTISQEPVNTK